MNSLPTPVLVVLSSVLWGLLLACCGYIWTRWTKGWTVWSGACAKPGRP